MLMTSLRDRVSICDVNKTLNYCIVLSCSITTCDLGMHMSTIVKLSITVLLITCIIMPVKAEPVYVKTAVVDNHTIEVSIKNFGAMPSTKVDILVVDKYGYLAYKGSRSVTFSQNEQKDLFYAVPDLPFGRYSVQTYIYKDTNSAIQPTYYYNWNAAVLSIEAQPSSSPSASPPKNSPSPLPATSTTSLVSNSTSPTGTENATTVGTPLSNTSNVTEFEGSSRGGFAIPTWMFVTFPIIALFALALFLLFNENSQNRYAMIVDREDRNRRSGRVIDDEARTKYARKTRVAIDDDENALTENNYSSSGEASASRSTIVPIEDSEFEEEG